MPCLSYGKSMPDTCPNPSFFEYFSAAQYYLDEEKDINKAKAWIDTAVEMTEDKPRFWVLRVQSLIYAAAGDKAGAIKAAKSSLTHSEEAGNDDYIKMNKESLDEWMQ